MLDLVQPSLVVGAQSTTGFSRNLLVPCVVDTTCISRDSVGTSGFVGAIVELLTAMVHGRRYGALGGERIYGEVCAAEPH